jgi:adenylyltransferase/sulfurtransferase
VNAAPTFCVVGAGGLGCPALLGLACAITSDPELVPHALEIVDHDAVEGHNLQRQVLYTLADVGARKVDAACFRLRSRHRDLAVATVERRLAPADVDAFVAARTGSIVIECTDSPALKFAFNDACLRHDVPLVIGAALGLCAQVMAVVRGRACYRCVYEAPPPVELVPTCAAAGVLGPVVGVAGFLVARLALALASGDADSTGRLHALDLRAARMRELAPNPRPGCPACELHTDEPRARSAALATR